MEDMDDDIPARFRVNRCISRSQFAESGADMAKSVVRKHVEHLDIDRPLYPDHTKMKEVVRSCEILEEVEKAVGSLE